MDVTSKLIGFGAVLLLVFGGAVLVGGAIGPDRDGSAAARGHEAETGGDSMAAHGTDGTGADPVRGLAVAAGGLRLDLQQTELRRDRPTELHFSIVRSDGRPVRDFEVEHEKRMHLIVVRRDGQGFQHLHPRLGDDGVWRVPLTLPDGGAYRVFADFNRDGEAQTLAADLAVDGEASYEPLPAPATTAATDDGYEVQLDSDALRAGREAELRFTVTRDGRTIRTQPYLGAGGHLVALREGDLAYLHVHPEAHGEAVSFMTELPSEGRYRLYLQFKHEGRVHTAELTQEVAR
ncbi:MAG TPA: hypothetical protein VEX36_09460 [Thermoleophilaceae bacterium]|nr:hypothetical protein [Thermoleophilaceae bacterium]